MGWAHHIGLDWIASEEDGTWSGCIPQTAGAPARPLQADRHFQYKTCSTYICWAQASLLALGRAGQKVEEGGCYVRRRV